jgi:CheY-like chemotaxis protein
LNEYEVKTGFSVKTTRTTISDFRLIIPLATCTGMKDSYYFNKALILDDNSVDIFILKKNIEHAKFAREVESFEHPLRLFDWLQSINKHQYHLLPEIIFMDLNMPVINGFELIEKIQNELPEISRFCNFAIVTSSSNPNDMIRSAVHKNVLAYLIKPVEDTDLNPEKFLQFKEKYTSQRNMQWF